MARPDDYRRCAELAHYGATNAELAKLYGVTPRTITVWRGKPEYVETIELLRNAETEALIDRTKRHEKELDNIYNDLRAEATETMKSSVALTRLVRSELDKAAQQILESQSERLYSIRDVNTLANLLRQATGGFRESYELICAMDQINDILEIMEQ